MSTTHLARAIAPHMMTVCFPPAARSTDVCVDTRCAEANESGQSNAPARATILKP
jgi:hypothetical protein